MAFLNEFPHIQPDKLNLDWLLEQYATFEERLEQIKEAFEKAVEEMEADLASHKADVQQTLNNFQTEFTNFQSDIRTEFVNFRTVMNNQFANLSDDISTDLETYKIEIDETISSIENIVDEINQNTIEYLEENMPEYQTAVINDLIANEIYTSKSEIEISNMTQIEIPQDGTFWEDISQIDLIHFGYDSTRLKIKISNQYGYGIYQADTEAGTVTNIFENFNNNETVQIISGMGTISRGMTHGIQYVHTSFTFRISTSQNPTPPEFKHYVEIKRI